jgi:predicted nucleic acid-binding protein
MSVLLFSDNTVLINFAMINRMDLLSAVLNGKGTWCASVADECHRSSRRPGLEDLALARDILGVPLYPNGREHLDIRALRSRLARPGDGPKKHLGEAETIVIIGHRQLNAFFVTDDREAMRVARSTYGIRVTTTWDLLRAAHRAGRVDDDVLWGYLATLRAAGRGGPPGVTARKGFDEWVAAT